MKHWYFAQCYHLCTFSNHDNIQVQVHKETALRYFSIFPEMNILVLLHQKP